MNPSELQYLLGVAGIVAFAMTGVLAVTRRGADLFGACVMGLITAIGGGTIRDVILGVPVFWSTDLSTIWVALIASMVAFVGNRLVSRRNVYTAMLYVDALGVSMFAIEAAEKVMVRRFGMPLAPILLGVLTAIGGGLLRDVLAGNTNLLMRPELYAIPVTIGCTLYVILLAQLPAHAVPIGVGCAALTFAVRAGAIHWGWSVPLWMRTQAKAS